MDEDSAGSPGHTPATIRFPWWEPLAAINLAFGDGWNPTHKIQWPFQEPKPEVPTIYKAYIRSKFQGISP